MRIIGWLVMLLGAALICADYRHHWYRSAIWIAFCVGNIFSAMAAATLFDWRRRRDIREFARVL